MKPYGQSREANSAALKRGDLSFAVYGLGKMGLPLAVSFAEVGGRVIGADVNAQVVETIQSGKCHIKGEPGLAEYVARHVRNSALRATVNLEDAARQADVHVIIVPTLLTPTGDPDLRIVKDVATAIAAGLHVGDLVVQEATVPPGTCKNVLVPLLEKESGLVAGRDFGVAYCPERTASGRALIDIRGAYPKIVGGIDKASTEAAAGIYSEVNQKGVLEMSSATAAEAVKIAEGLYRDVNIALANELALVCEDLGVDALEVIDRANTQPYCNLHKPGPGVGGHCIPVYPYFITRVSAAPTPLLRTSRAVNDGMPAHVLALLTKALGTSVSGKRILVLGMTYRPGVEETRYSPSVTFADLLSAAGAEVFTHDPLVGKVSAGHAVHMSEGPPENLDGIVIMTEDPLWNSFDWSKIVATMRTAVLVDTRRSLPREISKQLEVRVVRLGDGGPS